MASARAPSFSPPDRVCLGVIVGAHGVRGEVKVKAFTADPAALGAYGPLSDEPGRRSFALDVVTNTAKHVIARIDGVTDRDAAEALKGARLFVPRAALPPTEDEEYYHADLIGLEVAEPGGEMVGRIVAVQDFGAGHVLEIACADGARVMVLFSREAVPEIDVSGGRIVLGDALSVLAAR